MLQKFFLIGRPKSGKTTLGKLAAQELGLQFYDIDTIAYKRVIQQNGRIPIHPFSLRAAMLLKDAMQDALFELAKKDETAIVSTGAEVALIPYCAEKMQRTGIIIHIKRDIKRILKDIDENKGFYLENMTTGEKISIDKRTVELYMDELPFYEELTDISLTNDGTIEEGVANLQALIRQFIARP